MGERRAKELLRRLGVRIGRARETRDTGEAPRMQVAQIAQKLGMPEDKVAQVVQMIRENGMDDAQMGFMMRAAVSRGVGRDQIMQMMTSMGVSCRQVVRVMQAQSLMDDEEAQLVLEEERAGRERVVAARGASKRIAGAKKALIVLFWLVVWEVLDRAVDNRLVLAGPVRVLEALAEQVAKPDFWLICGASTARIAAGFLLSFSVGLLLALLPYRVAVVRDFIDPVMSLLRTIPVISFIIMLLIWVGNQALTVYLAFLIVLPLVYTSTLAGFESVDRHLLEMARVFKLSRWRTFMYVYRPAFMPFLVASSRISLGMSWKSGIMAEVLAVPKPSIGKEMSLARTYLDTPDLFAWTVMVMVLSLAFEKAFMALLKRAGRPLGGFLGVRDDEREGRARRGRRDEGGASDAGKGDAAWTS